MLVAYVLLIAAFLDAPSTSREPTVALNPVPYGTMHFLLEKTVLKIDAARMHIVVGSVTAERIESAIAGNEYDKKLRDRVADTLMQTQNADIHLTFLVSAGENRFFDGSKKSTKRMVKAGVISEEFGAQMQSERKFRYSFLVDRGLKDGDQLFYVLRGDTVSVRCLDAAGTELMNDSNVGAQRRIALLGSYFVSGSDFRDGLIRSLFEPKE